MRTLYPVHECSTSPKLWLLVAAMIIASIFLVNQAAGKSVLVEFGNPDNILENQIIFQPLPVPEPPLSQPAPIPGPSATPILPKVQLRPIPQPVPTPPPGQ